MLTCSTCLAVFVVNLICHTKHVKFYFLYLVVIVLKVLIMYMYN